MKHINLAVKHFIFLFTLFLLFAVRGFSQAESEPNNTFAQANPMTVGIQATGTACAGDLDFFKTKLPADGTIKVYVEATNTGTGNGYFYINGYYRNQQNVFGERNSANNVAPNSVTYDTFYVNCIAADSFYFSVRQYSQCFDYKIKYDVISQSTNDAEPNNDFPQAVALNAGTQVAGHIGYLSNGTTDTYDFYKTLLPADGTLRVYVEATNTGNGSGYFYVTGYDRRQGSGQLFDRNSAVNVPPGSITIDSFDVNCMAADSFYFRIRQAYQCFSYKLRYVLLTQSTNDAEPNDDFTQALPMTAGTQVVGHIGYNANGTTDTYDFYKTLLPADGTLRVYVEATNTGSGNGYFYVTGYDRRQGGGQIFDRNSAVNVIPGSVTIDSFDVNCMAADSFYFRIRQAYQCFSYKLRYVLLTQSANDAEPNNGFTQTIPIMAGTQVQGHIGYNSNGGSDDFDFYKTVLPSDGILRVYVEATNTGNGNGYFYVTGYDRRQINGQLFDQNSASNVIPGSVIRDTFNLYCIAKDTFYFRVRRAYQCFSYKLKYEMIGPATNDAEPNNSFAEAAPFTIADTVKGHIGATTNGVSDDYDYFKTVLPADGTMRVYVEATNTGNGNGYFYVTGYDRRQDNGQIFDRNSAVNVPSQSVTIDSFDVNCVGADTFYFRVRRAYQCFAYKLSYKITGLSITDPEPNNSFAQAIPVANKQEVVATIGRYTAGLSDDNDFYKINLPLRGTARIYIQATNTGSGNGYFYLDVYNKSQANIFNKTIATNVLPGSTTYDTLNLYCLAADSFYFRITRYGQCFSYKLSYELTLGADTTVYVCPGFTTNIGGLYNTKPFSTVKYEDMASPGPGISPNNVPVGTYRLSVYNGTDACSRDTAMITVANYPQPMPAFTINNNAQCVNGNSFTFTNTSTISSGTITYLWNFGDTTSSTATSPSHTYSSAGTYTVKLVVTSNNGCKDSVTQSVTVYPKPAPAFTINNNAQCVNGNSFTFTNTSTISSGTITYLWDLGDNTTSTATSPSRTYTSAGTYTVKLVVTSNNGCKDSVTQSVTVYPKPAPAFTINNNAQCVNGNSFTFTNTSTISSGTITYLWDFGDNTSSTTISPSRTYTSAGTYTVKLVVTSNNGCKDSVTQSVTVYPKPAPGFTINNNAQCVNGNSFTFTNTSTISSGTITYLWNFGDTTSSTATSPSHTYSSAGTYTVKLVVISNNGCKDSVTQSVTVYPKPAPAFTIGNNAQCVNGNSFTFTNTSTISSGTITYLWDLGDNTSSTAPSPSRTYGSAGTYTVKLVVTSNNGCKDSVTQNITVYPKPTPGFTINNNAQCVNGNSFTFTNTSTIGSGTITYLWDFGDNTSSTTPSPSRTYSSAGTYTVKLVVTSNNGCKDSVTQNIIVDPKPTPGFTINNNAQCVNGNSFTFTNTSTISSGTITYVWDFGDNTSSTAPSPSRIYSSAGTYTVKLVVTSNNGCKDSVTQNITVDTKPTPGFTINNNAQCVNGNSFTFTNTSTISSGTITYLWDFGDNTSSTAPSPSRTYSSAGNYTVKLVVTSNNGCKDSIAQSITVYPKPDLGPDKTTTASCAGGTADITTLYNTTGYTTVSYSTPNPSAAPIGTHQLYVVNSNGCKDTANITVTDAPVSTVPTSGSNTKLATRECTDAQGWTHYYHDNGTPGDFSDDIRILSLKKNGNNIGTTGVGGFQVKTVATTGAGSNSAVLITNPKLANSSGFYAMNRYWQVIVTQQPASNVGVRFYYNTQDLGDVNGSHPLHNINHAQLVFYKVVGGNPDPTSNLAGASQVISLYNGSLPGTNTWTHNMASASIHFAEFEVSQFSGGGAGAMGNLGVLPLTLLSFDASLLRKDVNLSWKTSAEINTSHFIVERSFDGATFNSIGNVNAAGNSAGINNYNFTDTGITNLGASIIYYRIKEVDIDGRFMYSRTIAIRVDNALNAPLISAFPNPFTQYITLKVVPASARDKTNRVELYSLQGVSLYKKEIGKQGLTITVLNDLPNLPSGMYILKTIVNGIPYTTRIVKN